MDFDLKKAQSQRDEYNSGFSQQHEASGSMRRTKTLCNIDYKAVQHQNLYLEDNLVPISEETEH